MVSSVKRALPQVTTTLLPSVTTSTGRAGRLRADIGEQPARDQDPTRLADVGVDLDPGRRPRSRTRRAAGRPPRTTPPRAGHRRARAPAVGTAGCVPSTRPPRPGRHVRPGTSRRSPPPLRYRSCLLVRRGGLGSSPPRGVPVMKCRLQSSDIFRGRRRGGGCCGDGLGSTGSRASTQVTSGLDVTATADARCDPCGPRAGQWQSAGDGACSRAPPVGSSPADPLTLPPASTDCPQAVRRPPRDRGAHHFCRDCCLMRLVSSVTWL